MTADALHAEFWDQSGGHCDCCGNQTCTIWGGLSDASGARAAYFVRWTVGQPQHLPYVDLILGLWGEGTGPQDRVLVSLCYRPQPGGGSFMVVSATGRPGDDRKLCGRALEREEVIGTPLAQEVFALADALWLTEPRIADVRALDDLVHLA